MDDIRWKQRFQNYKKALATLQRSIESCDQKNELHRLGVIQAFEFTQELSWKVLKDFIEAQGGGDKIYGSKDSYRQAFNRDLISDGELWLDMIDSRNKCSYLYDEATATEIFEKVQNTYMPCFFALELTFDELCTKE